VLSGTSLARPHRLSTKLATLQRQEALMKAKDIMTKDPRVVTPETTVQEAARLMQSEDTGVLPVVESSGSHRLIGMITDRDIAIRVVAEGRTGASVRDAMSTGVRSARPDDDAKDVMDLMASEQVRRVPIVDASGMVVGIVSQADIVLEGDDKRAERTIEAISQPNGR
jgi:CBS domain-containing protein